VVSVRTHAATLADQSLLSHPMVSIPAANGIDSRPTPPEVFRDEAGSVIQRDDFFDDGAGLDPLEAIDMAHLIAADAERTNVKAHKAMVVRS
jgi:hypothetical protein